MSTISACELIMLTNNKTGDWLSSKFKEELEKLVDIARKKKNMTELKNIKNEKKKV